MQTAHEHEMKADTKARRHEGAKMKPTTRQAEKRWRKSPKSTPTRTLFAYFPITQWQFTTTYIFMYWVRNRINIGRSGVYVKSDEKCQNSNKYDIHTYT